MTTTVLVVEDEAKLRELLRSYFEREGMVVLSTASGSEAIDLAERVGPTSSSLTSVSPTSRGRTSRGTCGDSWMYRF